MFDFREYRPPVWPEHLKPHGQEGFGPWWDRHSSELGHLPPELAEQWIHRHWSDTSFMFLPLDSLEWGLVEMGGEEILATVVREISTRLDPEFDYEQLHGLLHFEKSQTARELDEEGTWRLPIVALATPTGWRSKYRDLPDARLMLLEGHQRHRYLNALHARGTPPAGPHRVFIVHSPEVE